MRPMKIVSASEIEEMASAHWPDLVDAAQRSLVALATGQCEAPLRTALPLISGTLLTMPGRLTGMRTALVKLISVVPKNPARGMPNTQGVAVLFDGETGEPLSLLDGRALTAREDTCGHGCRGQGTCRRCDARRRGRLGNAG